jgi:hypothetical protein
VIVVAVLAAGVSSAGAVTPMPAWSVQVLASPTNFKPGEVSGLDTYEVFFTNSGSQTTDHSPITLTDTLPAGLSVKSVELQSARYMDIGLGEPPCETATTGEISTVTCVVTDALEPENEPATLHPDDELQLRIHVEVPPSASGTLVNRAMVTGGGARDTFAKYENLASSEPAPAGFEQLHATLSEPNGSAATGADSHPYEYTTEAAVNVVPAQPGAGLPFLPAGGDLKDIEVALPPGLIGNPTVSETCTPQQFNTITGVLSPTLVVGVDINACPEGSAVGLVTVEQFEGSGSGLREALYNLRPPKGMPAQFGFQVLGLPVYIDTKLRSDGDYGVTTFVPDTPQAKRVTAFRAAIWGVPADARHDVQRGSCALLGGSCPASPTLTRPFLRLPSSCQDPLETTMTFDTWLHPGAFLQASSGEPAPLGCSQPDFSPTLQAKPTTGVADSPTGLHVDLHLPQKQHEDSAGLGEADLRDTSVTLPEGLLVNPASADGLAGCSEAQVGYQGIKEGRQTFSAEPAGCPDASKIGTVEVDTPLLDHPLPGSVYLASPFENPFASLLGIYIAVYDPQTGVVVKLAGHVEPNPVTGQLTTTVTASPQVPFEDFKLDFFEGPRASLRTPATCGAHTATTSLTPWTSPEGATATPSDSFQITSAPGGGACPGTPAAQPNSPAFQAGTTTPTAGAYSPLVVRLNREDGSQNFSQLSVTLPPGATGKLAGIPQCSEAQIAAAQARDHPGEGAAEQASPSCPASSTIGTVTVGAGAGPDPFFVTGHAYLAGPYKGAPFSGVFVTPAIAGPFDLGVVVVRAGLYVDPSTAQVTTKSDPLPSILQGIPLDIRSLTVDVDRPEFTLNPTNCAALSATGQETSTLGAVASLSAPFRAGGCARLQFKPSFSASTQGNGSLNHNTGASLTVKVASRQGPSSAAATPSEANIAKVDVSLPLALPSRLTTLQKACTEGQFAANPAGCPSASNVGTAVAYTPLLAGPLVGPAYLVSHGGAAFPDLEIILQGEGVTVDLVGHTQIKKGITYSRFDTVPDAPISSFELKLPEGPFSVLAATTNLCAPTKTVTVSKRVTRRVRGRVRHETVKVSKAVPEPLLMPTTMTAQNGAVLKQETKIAVTGCAKAKAKKAKKAKGKKKSGRAHKRKRR